MKQETSVKAAEGEVQETAEKAAVEETQETAGETAEGAAQEPAANTAKAAARNDGKKKKLKFHEYSAENDMQYKGPLNYQTFQMLGWLCMVAMIVVAVIAVGSTISPSVEKKYGKLAEVLSYVASLSLPFLLMANFSKILANKEGYKKQLLRNGGVALAIFLGTLFFGGRYIIGTLQQLVKQEDQVLPLVTETFREYDKQGFLAFNLFIDLFLCTLSMYFLNARPKRVFTGKKIIILRLFTIIPIAYELACLVLKVQAARGKITLPLWTFPLLTVKPPMTFAFFVFIALLVRFREYRYCKHGKTHEEYLQFMNTNRNSFQLSVHLCLWMILFAAIDGVLMLVLSYLQATTIVTDAVKATSEAVEAAWMDGVRVAFSVGVGGSIVLALAAPLMLLYSYNSEPKNKMLSLLIPAVGIFLMFLVVLEAIRMGVGMVMETRKIDLDAIRQVVQQILQ